MSTPILYEYQPDQGPIAVPNPSDEMPGGDGPQYEGPSFELLAIKWGNFLLGTSGGVVTWSFASFNSNVQPDDVTFNTPMPSFFQDVVRSAFNAWEAVADIDFVEVADSSNVNIRVGVGSVDGPGSTLGVAHYSFSGGKFNQVHIIMDSVDYSSPSDSGEFYLTILHEIGHAIGLDHEPSALSIMSAFINTSLTGLTADDITGVQSIYGAGDGVVSDIPPPTFFDDFPTENIDTDGTVVVGDTASGQIEISGDEDWFAVEVEAGRIYQFDLQGGTLSDTYLTLRGAQGQVFTTNDDGGPGLDSRITFTSAITDTVYLVAEAYSTGVGTYTLTALDISPPTIFDDFPTESIDTDGAVVVGQSQSGDIETVNDTDWFAVDVIAGRVYQFDLSGNTLTNPYLTLRLADSSVYIINDNGGPGIDSRITYTATATGTLYLVAEANSTGVGTYTLTALDISPPPIPGITVSEGLSDSPGSIGTSDVVISGDTFEGRLANGTDHDFIRIELRAGVAYTFELQGVDTEGGTLANPVLSLRDASGNLISSNDDGGTVFDPSIAYTPTASGSYYLEASTDNTMGGTYSLVTTPDQRTALDSVVNPGMTVSEGTNDVPGSNVSDRGIDPGDNFSGVLSSSQDVDYIRINLTDRFEYTVELQGEDSEGGTLPDPSLELRDKFGNLIASNNNSGPGLDALLTFTATKSDYYFLVVRTTGAEGGTYNLIATESDDPIPVVVQEGSTDAPASVSTGIDLIIGDIFEGEISALGDIDYARVELTAGARYKFDLKGNNSGDGTLDDPFLVLRDENGAILRQNEDGGITSASRIIYIPEDSGTYYLSAHTPAVGGGTGTYTLFTEQTATPYPGIVVTEGDEDVTASFLTDTEMFVGGTFVGDIGEANDQDAVWIHLVAGTTYTMDMRGITSGVGTIADPYLRLVDSESNTVAQDDDDGEGRESHLVFTPTVSGTYILKASGFASSHTGTYELSVTANSSPQSAEVVAPLDDGYTVSSTDPLDVLANLVDTGQFSG